MIFPVVLSGGTGSRLWPLSRTLLPKQFLPLVGTRTMLQETLARLKGMPDLQPPVLVCSNDHRFLAAEQLREIAVMAGAQILEPAGRNTAPAVAVAALQVMDTNPEGIMLVLPADHLIRDVAQFHKVVATAASAAAEGRLVTFGIVGREPETGYGYIERSDAIVGMSNGSTAYQALRFVEKPPLETAQEYLASGRFLWNASMFIWKCSTLLEFARTLMPDLLEAVTQIVDVWDTPDREVTINRIWDALPESTIDQGIMEKADRVAVVPADIGWSDVGDWHGLGELIEHDGLGNSVRGDLIQVETRSSVVWSETGRLVALVGLENVVVVDCDDALLVIDRSRSQDVRKIVGELKRLSRHEFS